MRSVNNYLMYSIFWHYEILLKHSERDIVLRLFADVRLPLNSHRLKSELKLSLEDIQNTGRHY